MNQDRTSKVQQPVRLEWDTDQIFATSSREGEAAIKVNRAVSEDGRQFYSYEFGRVAKDGGFTRFLVPVVSKTPNWKAKVEFSDLEEYKKLLVDVQAHIQSGIQAGFDAALDKRRDEPGRTRR